MTTSTPKIGPAAFWEMVALTMGGQLASCVSCVEYFYFQSTANSSLFLEACASAGLLQRMPLLDLFGEVGPRVDPGQRRYDEPIFLSAPEYQVEYPDEARNRLTNTKNAVNSALRIFYDELRADEKMVAAAYSGAITEKVLRFFDVAATRRHVKHSFLSMVRLILDGYRALHKTEHRDRTAVADTIRFIRRFADVTPPAIETNDVGFELETFITEFITSPEKIHDTDFAKKVQLKVNSDYWIKWLPVMLNLAWGRSAALKKDDRETEAENFSSHFVASISSAIQRENANEAAAEVLHSLNDEWHWMMAQPAGSDVPPWMSPILNPATTPLHWR